MAIIIPKKVPNKKPIIVSWQVTLICCNKLFEDKLKKVSSIRDGLLIIKLSIIPLFASTSHNTIMPITILNWTIFIDIFSIFLFCKYFFLSCDIFLSLFMYI